MQKRITNIVFTKNRPMQLHGYLEGLRRFFSAELIQTVILYKPELFDTEYEYCFSQFPDCQVAREADFHSDMLSVIEAANTDYLLFGVDDVVYFDGVDFDVIDETFQSFGSDLFGFSLRLDKRQMPEDIEADNLIEHQAANQAVYTVDWTKGRTKNTGYPFEVGGTIYRAQDIKRIIAGTMRGGDFMHTRFAPSSALTKLIGGVYSRRKFLKKLGYFFNPNTFESWNCRYVQNNSEEYGNLLAFQKICSSAIAVNMVNTSTNNEWVGADEFTVETLNKKYQKGIRIDIEAIINDQPLDTHSLSERLKFKQR